MNNWQLFFTCDDYVLPFGGGSIKTAKEGAASEILAARTWKFIWNADLHVFSSLPTAINSIEKLDPLDNDWSVVVKGNPGCNFRWVGKDFPNNIFSDRKNINFC